MMTKHVMYAFFVFCMYQTFGLPDDVNPEEISGNFEGDMILSPEQNMAISEDGRNGIIGFEYRWPDKIVYYRITADDFTAEQNDYIRHAMDVIEGVSCVMFVEANEDATDYVQITGENPGCTSMVGFRGGEQPLNIGPNELEMGCFRLVAIMHELLHTLGFFHMQSAPDRDDYITIVWENIKPGHKHDFRKFNSSAVIGFNVEYDYESIMHYREDAFSVNGEPTMIPNDPFVKIERHYTLSEGDVKKLNRMYRCHRE